MSTYRKEWDCCGGVSETESYEPDECPFCAPPTKLLAKLEKAEAEAKKWKEAEESLSAAYVNLRLVLGAMNPPFRCDPPALWDYVNEHAKSLVNERDVLAVKIKDLNLNCDRSHPHENMNLACELRAEIAKVKNENAHLQAENGAVNAKLKAFHDQKPVAWRAREGSLYAHPVPARELTDETIQRHWDEACKDTPQTPGWSRHIRFARAIERHLKGESE